MDERTKENMEMSITRLEEEIKQAKDQLWRMLLNGESIEKVVNVKSYIRYLENEKKKTSH
ncbi:hypothetical protein FQ085_06645 [Planococcus sp. ANT_H30]|uniref:hypothetical protein n=1 Tax=Planococcus TaxID=1372 RepID=UPI0011EE6DFC|nr:MULTISPECIES: hypothetical protein [Planococcus]KAA0957725.1 hypothetical protein FQ085_06645 [Planococcus sp. ANT_H30]MCH4825754.1 hypothetical protein [Planococcus halocryophilus]